MSVTIPPEWPDWLTRGHFPVGDPDAIRASADWARSAEHLTRTLHHLERLARDVAGAIQGEAGDAIGGQLETQIAALAESVVAVGLRSGRPIDVWAPEPTDGQRVLFALLMKHSTP